ncbi:hypothetical protein P8452_26927 [Trifolium repens]|nr:hypothetical protein P8452_26927 [Trifolium repens]
MKTENKARSVSIFFFLLHHLFAATSAAAPFRPSQGGGFPPIFSTSTSCFQFQVVPLFGDWCVSADLLSELQHAYNWLLIII